MPTEKKSKPRKRKTPLLADGREEIFLPEWLKTGSYNLVRVADERPPSKPLAK
ncbi:hypothetical protein [Tessaracoccus sp. Y1736]